MGLNDIISAIREAKPQSQLKIITFVPKNIIIWVILGVIVIR